MAGHGDEQRFEAEMAQALKLSMFTHSCEESARLDEDVSIAWAEAVPQALVKDSDPEPETEVADDEESQLAEVLRLSKLSDVEDRQRREVQDLQEDEEVERVKRLSLALAELPELTSQEEQDVLLAMQLSLCDDSGATEKHVTWAPQLDDAPAKPMPLPQVAEPESAVERPTVASWTLKVQLDTESRRVPVSWPAHADNETIYLALCTAAKDAFGMDLMVDVRASSPSSDLHYVDDSGDEVGLIPAAVPDFLSFGQRGVLKLLLRTPAMLALPEPSAPSFECFQASEEPEAEEEEKDVGSEKDIMEVEAGAALPPAPNFQCYQDVPPTPADEEAEARSEKDIIDDEAPDKAPEKDIIDDEDADCEWVTVDIEDVHKVYGTPGCDDDLAESSS